MTLLLVLLGGAVGAPVRYLADRALKDRAPLGTFIVNVAGSALLGVLIGAGDALPATVKTLVGTGFCGALTTYSTFSLETLMLVEAGRARRAALYATASLALGLAAAATGFATARALT
ncbi:fluoride efflux transporter CrcB [Dactylosporangium aurantiacum]|uniref:Fluoride-specific ion channel FluC n=1 Tax=Dactylosporangium aurantiacum TaxID=35754 RepID=A0A9Q9MLU5_9ACTN|nr:fluoride efflux transporter CrcB [Dactylosporangium aurantiacum]MDG6108476.1 fluoride efflux transporter CrcB [Dactylosporangium aurantiacum]UWZ57341.1 fluoride efflux transporter CrcB [Dactylosporangium aurantiacum]